MMRVYGGSDIGVSGSCTLELKSADTNDAFTFGLELGVKV